MVTANPRPVILSTQMLQDQILRCCCEPAPAASPSAALPAATQPEPAPAAQAVLNIWQRMNRVAETHGGVQIVVTLINSGARIAEDVVLTVTLSPVLPKTRYKLKAGPEWQAATLAKLESAPVALEPGKARTLSLEIAPVRKKSKPVTKKKSVSKKKSAAVSVTSIAFAVSSNPAVSSRAGALTVSIGE